MVRGGKRKGAAKKLRLGMIVPFLAAGALASSLSAARAQQVRPHAGLLQAVATDREFRVGAFRHFDAILPSRVVRRGGSAAQLPRAEGPLDVTYTLDGKQHPLSDLLEATNATGLLVIKDGKIVFEKYFLGADEHSRFTSMSMAKSFTSTLVGMAIADGKIANVNRAVTDYVPELKGSGYDGIPIRDVLQMSSGVKFSEAYNGTDDLSNMWTQCVEENKQSLDDYARSLAREEPAGKRFYYRSIDTQVLGWVVRSATGEHLADYLSRKLWQPMGAESDASWIVDGSGAEASFCCIQATLRDYARFGMMFLNRGKANGNQIVPASWVTEATTPDAAQVQPGKLMPAFPLGYQYQWWTFAGGLDHPYAAEGVFFQFIYIAPHDNVVIVKTSANDGFWDDARERETYAAFEAITAALRGSATASP